MSPLDELLSMDGPAADATRDSIDNLPLPGELPENTNRRVLTTQAANQRVQRVRAGDLASRQIPSFKDASGDVQPVTDAEGAPLTQYDRRNRIGWDSKGEPKQLVYTGEDGPPELRDPFAGIPEITDKAGYRYQRAPGLPDRYLGQDPKMARQNELVANAKELSAASTALGRQLTLEEHDLHTGSKEHEAMLGRLAVDVPRIADAKSKEEMLKGIDAHFNEEYAKPEANTKAGWFGRGDYTPEAAAARSAIDAQKLDAKARVEQAFALREQLTAKKKQVAAQRALANTVATQQANVQIEQLRAQGLLPPEQEAAPQPEQVPVEQSPADPAAPAQMLNQTPGRAQPEDVLTSLVRPIAAGAMPAIGTALGGISGAALGGLAGLETGPGAIATAIVGDIAGGAAGGTLAQKAQNAVMGEEWTKENQAQMAANLKEHPIASKIGAFIPAVISMLGGGGGKPLQSAVGRFLEHTAEKAAGHPGYVAKALAALPQSMTIGARMGAGAAAQQAVLGQGEYSDILEQSAKGAVTMGPVAFVPAAGTMLGAIFGKAPADAAILATSNALYEQVVHGKEIDGEQLAREIGTDIPGFVLMNVLSTLTHARPVTGRELPPEMPPPAEEPAPEPPAGPVAPEPPPPEPSQPVAPGEAPTVPASTEPKPPAPAPGTTFRGTTMDEWDAVQNGESFGTTIGQDKDPVTGKLSGGTKVDSTWAIEDRNYAENYASRNPNGVVIEFKPEARGKFSPVIEDSGGGVAHDNRLNGKGVTIDDVARVHDSKGNLIYEAPNEAAPPPETGGTPPAAEEAPAPQPAREEAAPVGEPPAADAPAGEAPGDTVPSLTAERDQAAQAGDQMTAALAQAKLDKLAPASMDEKAHEAATSPTNGLSHPSEAQIEAGNYQKGHVNIGGLDISIENPAGSVRRGTDREGNPWSVEMKSHYGYIRGSEGKDGDHIDAFIVPGTPADYQGPVFVINQQHPDGTLDEHKAVIGTLNPQDARLQYLANYTGLKHDPIQSVASFPDVASFKTWATERKRIGAAKSPAELGGEPIVPPPEKFRDQGAKRSAELEGQKLGDALGLANDLAADVAEGKRDEDEARAMAKMANAEPLFDQMLKARRERTATPVATPEPPPPEPPIAATPTAKSAPQEEGKPSAQPQAAPKTARAQAKPGAEPWRTKPLDQLTDDDFAPAADLVGDLTTVPQVQTRLKVSYNRAKRILEQASRAQSERLQAQAGEQAAHEQAAEPVRPEMAPPAVTPPSVAVVEPARAVVKAAEQQVAAPDTSAKKMKVQKAYLLDALDKAIEQAPENISDSAKGKSAAWNDSKQIELSRGRFGKEVEDEGQINKYSPAFAAEVNRRTAEENTTLFDQYKIPAGREAFAAPKSLEGTEVAPSVPAKGFTDAERLDLLEKVLSREIGRHNSITIEVPGDGTFTLINTKDNLRDFRKTAQKFPVSTQKASEPPSPASNPTQVPAIRNLKQTSDYVKVAGMIASEDETREVLRYVMSNGKQLVSTDGKRLVILDEKAGGTEKAPLFFTPDGKPYAPPKTYKDEKGKDQPYSFNYPNYKQVVPEANTYEKVATADTSSLFKMLAQARRILTEKDTAVHLFVGKDGEVGMTAISNKEDRDWFGGEYSSGVDEDTAKLIGIFNAEFLMDAVRVARAIGHEKIELRTRTEQPGDGAGEREPSNHPLVIKAPGMLQVLMPMRGAVSGMKFGEFSDRLAGPLGLGGNAESKSAPGSEKGVTYMHGKKPAPAKDEMLRPRADANEELERAEWLTNQQRGEFESRVKAATNENELGKIRGEVSNLKPAMKSESTVQDVWRREYQAALKTWGERGGENNTSILTEMAHTAKMYNADPNDVYSNFIGTGTKSHNAEYAVKQVWKDWTPPLPDIVLKFGNGAKVMTDKEGNGKREGVVAAPGPARRGEEPTYFVKTAIGEHVYRERELSPLETKPAEPEAEKQEAENSPAAKLRAKLTDLRSELQAAEDATKAGLADDDTPEEIAALKRQARAIENKLKAIPDDPKSLSDTVPERSVTPKNLQTIVDRLTARLQGGSPVEIVADGKEFPEAVRAEAESRGIDVNRIGGVYHEGKVWLNAAGIENLSRATEIFFHEQAGHAGVSKLLEGIDPKAGESLARILKKSFPEEWQHVADRYHPDEQVDETLARIMERAGPQMSERERGLWQRVVDFIRTTLAKGGLKQWSQADVKALLRRGLDRIRDPQDGAARSETKFSEKESDPAFYSQLTRAIETIPQETMTVAQAKATILKGAKADEIKLSGILDDPLSPLAGKQPGDKVSKSDLTGYALERQAKVRDVVLGKPENVHAEQRGGSNDWVVVDEANKVRGHYSSQALAEFDIRNRTFPGQEKSLTHFSQYQLPGAEEGSYREMFVTMPGAKTSGKAGAELEDWKRQAALKYGPDWTRESLNHWERERFDEYEHPSNWHDGHSQYGDITNPIVRIRRNLRTDVDGKKTYFLEEIQGPSKSEQEKMPPELRKRIYEIGMKRALRDAVDEGADSLSWTTGEQQAERYDLSKQADSVHYNQGTETLAVLKDGDLLLRKEGIKPEDLEQYVGKDAAKKLIEMPANKNGETALSGEGLKFGGEGLKRLYDVTLPRIANELAKKFGVKVGVVEMKVGEEGQYGGDTTLPRFEQRLKELRGAWEGPNRTPEGWRAWNVTFDRQARDVLDAMRGGMTYGAAMHDHGSEGLAEHFGGEYSITDKLGEVHSLDIPPELKAQQRGGNPLFSLEERPIRREESAEPARPAPAAETSALPGEATTRAAERVAEEPPKFSIGGGPHPSHAQPREEDGSFAEHTMESLRRKAAPGLDAAGEIKGGLQSLLLPSMKSEAHLEEAELLGSHLGAMNRRQESARAQTKGDWKTFARMGLDRIGLAVQNNPGIRFMSAMSRGVEMGPKLQAVADKIKGQFQSRLDALEKIGANLQTVRENYFPGMWTTPSRRAFNLAMAEAKEAGIVPEDGFSVNNATPEQKAWVRERVDKYLRQGKGSDQSALGYLTKRPLKGKESFRKQKAFDDIMDAAEFGLRPFSNNPIDLVNLKLAEMDRSIMGNEHFAALKEAGKLQIIDPYHEVPEGWVKVNDKYGTIYGAPTVSEREYVDKNVLDGLMGVAKTMGLEVERAFRAGRGRLGFASTDLKTTVSQFATELSVLAHEIGHQIDFRHNLWARLVTGAEAVGERGRITKTASAEKRGVIQKELRALADLTWEGRNPDEVSDHYKAKVRTRDEKMAHLLEAYVHAKEKFQEAAPTVFADFDRFIRSEPDLAPLANIKPGIALERLENERYIGLPILGYRIVPKEVGEALNNYLSSSLYNNPYFGKMYTGWMGLASALNQAQLGMGSAFHAGFTALESQISAGANLFKDLYGVAVGNRTMEQLGKSVVRTGTAMGQFYTVGDKLVNAWRHPEAVVDEHLRALVRAAELAGGGFTMERGMETGQAAKTFSAFHSGNLGEAAARSPIAAIELLARPMMHYLVPRQKAAVFAHLAGRIIEQNPGKSLEELTPEFRQAWNRTDARLGQVRYDRLFINNVAKNLVQGLVRAPGWTGGTIAEIGGAFKDMARFLSDWKRDGKPPADLPDRAAYTISLVLGTAIANGVLTYAFTGQQPKDLDYWAFRSGGEDEHGNPERFVIPTYMKDILAYSKDPLVTIGHKAHPLLSLMHDLWRNQDYYGVKIRNEDDKALQQAVDSGKYFVKAFEPFWTRGARRERERGGSVAKQAASFIGVMPAPKKMTQTPAEALADQFAKESVPIGGRTQQQAEASRAKYQIVEQLRRGETPNYQKPLREGLITHKDIPQLQTRARMTPLQYQVKKLSLDKAEAVYRRASDQEKREIGAILRQKREIAEALHRRQAATVTLPEFTGF